MLGYDRRVNTALERVTERINRLGDVNDPDTPRPLLTLAEFFDGNDVVGSIGCNLYPEVAPQQIRAVLEQIAARDDVADVRVVVLTFDDPEWPFAERVVVATSAAPEEVAEWFPEDLAPSDVWDATDDDDDTEPYEVPGGTRLVVCWWD